MVKLVAGAILAAGTGERLRPASGGMPKPLVEVSGKTLLALAAQALIYAGANPVVAVVNSETAGLIASRMVKLPAGLEVEVRDTPSSMETLFAIGGKIPAGRFLLATVDAIFPRAEFERFAAVAEEITDPKRPRAFDGALAVARWRGEKRPLFAEVGLDGLIGSLGGNESPMVTAGAYLFSTNIFRYVEDARAERLGAMREFLAMLVKNGMRFGAIEVTGAIDVDEAQDLEEARAMIAAQSIRQG